MAEFLPFQTQLKVTSSVPWSNALTHLHPSLPLFMLIAPESESEIRSVVSSSLRSMDYTIHGILQARILEWVAFPFSRGSSQLKDQTQVSCIAGRFFTS